MHNSTPSMCSYDAVVMLTWSDWFKELRSNRFHYASRFANDKLVIFVQQDLLTDSYEFIDTEFPNIIVLRIYQCYGKLQNELLNTALLEKGILKPLLWVYNSYFNEYIQSRYNALVVYHATEDYLESDSPMYTPLGNKQRCALEASLDNIDLLVSVSEGVEASIKTQSNYHGESHVITNGVDYKFYAPSAKTREEMLRSDDKNIFYQGNMSGKLDVNLLTELTTIMPDWNFTLCGMPLESRQWKHLCEKPNVNYLGLLTVEELREHAWQSTVGIIPFLKSDWLVKRSFPLKAFEYLACGLPVVSIPIDALMPFSNEIKFANNAQEFKDKILDFYQQRADRAKLEKRLQLASTQDYDLKYAKVKELIDEAISSRKSKASIRPKLNILILYDKLSIHVKTITEHLESFSIYSENNVFYANATDQTECILDLTAYDVIVIHYSIRLSVRGYGSALSESFSEKIRTFGGFKIAFIQDDYEGTEICRQWISHLGLHHIYTCVPNDSIEKIYPKKRFPAVKFEHSLTGFIPQSLLTSRGFIPLKNRKNTLAYRGRDLPFWYGDLGREKLEIGIRMKELCKKHNIPSDIEWESQHRIYHTDWYTFLRNTRAILGTESGCNIFDEDGTLKEKITAVLESNPGVSYEEVYSLYLKEHDNKVKMNQISPKIFEAIACGTILVLLEGEYSNIMQPDVHYISLKKDYSNVEDVFSRLNDLEALEIMRHRAYKDVVLSNKYSFGRFINDFDNMLKINAPRTTAVYMMNITTTTPTPVPEPAQDGPIIITPRYVYLRFVTVVSPYLKTLIPRKLRPIIKKYIYV